MQGTSWMQKALFSIVLSQMALTASQAHDLDLLNLQENFPMRMQDAYAIPEGAASVDLAVDVGLNCSPCYGGEWVQSRLQVEYGMGRGWQGVVGLRSIWSDYDQTGDGDIYVEMLKQIYETPRDALAAEIKLNFPTGQNYTRADTSIPGFTFIIEPRDKQTDVWLAAVYTRTLDKPERTRLHAQAQYGFINSAPQGVNDDRWFLALGADHQIASHTLLMANLWWEEDPHPPYCSSTVLQLGLRKQQRPPLIWALSLNFGLAPEPVEFGGTLAAQYGF